MKKVNRQGAEERQRSSSGWRRVGLGGAFVVELMVSAVLLTAVPAGTAFAQSSERIFADANAAVFAGDFERAAKHYQLLIDSGVHDADVYFNAGVVHARRGQLGRAALSFERSAWLEPGDETTEQELTAVYAALGKRRAERAGEATMRTRPPLTEALVRPISADTLAVIVLVLDVLFFALLLWLPRARQDNVKLGLTIAAPLCALLLLLFGAGLAIKTEWLREGSAALVLREEAELREGPDARAQVRTRAYEGQGARVEERAGAFVSVVLDGGQRGWMKRNDLGTIRPD
jgi:tetratricopeptide (TPR) repeat protein